MNNFFKSNPVLFTPSNEGKTKAELIAGIESGEIDHLDFQAVVFKGGKNRNFYRLKDEPTFPQSFEGRPFLRNHDQDNIESRDGTIVNSWASGGQIIPGHSLDNA